MLDFQRGQKIINISLGLRLPYSLVTRVHERVHYKDRGDTVIAPAEMWYFLHGLVHASCA